jgi:DNA-binding IclR family transcriptional regulator
MDALREPVPASVGAGRGIQSIEIGGRLLAALADAVQPMMLRDLAEAASMPPGQAHAYLVSFRKLELVEQDPPTGRYRLGPFALRLGLARLRAAQPYEVVSEALGRLVDALDLNAALTVWGTHGPTVVRVQEASHQIHANMRPGTVFGLTTTATGRLFAALMPPALIEPMLKAELRDPARHRGSLGLAALRADLAAIRAHGLAATEGQPIPGLNALAAPVFDHAGQIQVAVTIMGPSAIVDCSEASPQAAALLRFTQDLSERLGYRRAPAPLPDRRQA